MQRHWRVRSDDLNQVVALPLQLKLEDLGAIRVIAVDEGKEFDKFGVIESDRAQGRTGMVGSAFRKNNPSIRNSRRRLAITRPSDDAVLVVLRIEVPCRVVMDRESAADIGNAGRISGLDGNTGKYQQRCGQEGIVHGQSPKS
jgi:hypothetical protein